MKTRWLEVVGNGVMGLGGGGVGTELRGLGGWGVGVGTVCWKFGDVKLVGGGELAKGFPACP